MKQILIILTIFNSAIFGQEMAEIENEYNNLWFSLNEYQLSADSLQNRLNDLLDKIDKEKSNPQPEKGLLEEYLATALNFSNSIDLTNNKVDRLQNSLSERAIDLTRLYTHKLDSLNQVLENLKQQGKTNQQSEQLFLLYTVKRMQVSPELPNLSFDPLVLENIQPFSSDDTTDQKVYIDFLLRAQNELHNHFELVNNLEQQMREMIRLEEKALAFMEEIEDDAILPFSGDNAHLNNQATDVYERETFLDESSFNGGMNKYLLIDSRIRSIVILNDQLSGLDDYSIKSEHIQDLSNEKKLELLEETRQSLRHYMKIASKKLKDLQ